MERIIRDKQKFIVYVNEQSEYGNREIPHLFQMISKEDLVWQMDIAERRVDYYQLPRSMRAEQKLYREQLSKVSFLPISEADRYLYILEDQDQIIGYTDMRKLAKELADEYYAVEIGSYGCITHFNPYKDGEIMFDFVPMEHEWCLSEADVAIMESYDLYRYADVTGLMAYFDVYTDEIRECIDELSNKGQSFSEDSEIAHYERERLKLEESAIDEMIYEEFKERLPMKKHVLIGEQEIPRSFMPTYLRQIITTQWLGKRNKESLQAKFDQENAAIESQIQEIEQFMSMNRYKYSDIVNSIESSLYREGYE